MVQPSPRRCDAFPGLLCGLLSAVGLLLFPAASNANPSWPVWVAEPAADLAQVVLVPLAEQRITIDGDLEEWNFDKPLARFRGEELKRTGRTSLDLDEKSDLGVSFQACWDRYFLYVAVKVRDRSPALPDPETGWDQEDSGPLGTLFDYDGVSVNLQPYPDVLASARAMSKQPPLRKGWYDARFVMSPYEPQGQPRQYAGLSEYAAKLTEEGYVVEGRISFTSLGLGPAAGDQLAFCLHVVDASADEGATTEHYLWNVVPCGSGAMWWKGQREGDVIASWGRFRLADSRGWGANLIATSASVAPWGELTYVGTLDVGPRGLTIVALEIREAETGRVVQHIRVGQEIAGPGTYRLRGTFKLAGLAPGRYVLAIIDNKT